MLRFLVLGLVIVVPQLDCLPWLFLKPPGVLGVDGLIELDEIFGGIPAVDMVSGADDAPLLVEMNGEDGG
jgi:hypothetical protein